MEGCNDRRRPAPHRPEARAGRDARVGGCARCAQGARRPCGAGRGDPGSDAGHSEHARGDAGGFPGGAAGGGGEEDTSPRPSDQVRGRLSPQGGEGEARPPPQPSPARGEGGFLRGVRGENGDAGGAPGWDGADFGEEDTSAWRTGSIHGSRPWTVASVPHSGEGEVHPPPQPTGSGPVAEPHSPARGEGGFLRGAGDGEDAAPGATSEGSERRACGAQPSPSRSAARSVVRSGGPIKGRGGQTLSAIRSGIFDCKVAGYARHAPGFPALRGPFFKNPVLRRRKRAALLFQCENDLVAASGQRKLS
jgi:hypothetical protein